MRGNRVFSFFGKIIIFLPPYLSQNAIKKLNFSLMYSLLSVLSNIQKSSRSDFLSFKNDIYNEWVKNDPTGGKGLIYTMSLPFQQLLFITKFFLLSISCLIKRI